MLMRLLPALLLAVTSAIVWLLYAAALPGYFLFDDEFSLKGLAHIHDRTSALIFIFSGETGPLGRPVSLVTFAAQSGAWPDVPAAFLRVNITIHLLAISACFILSISLARLRSTKNTSLALWIGFGVAALWGLSPFLATTHLMVVQRMTSLAGLFTLAGLAAFAWAHLVADHQPRLARGLLISTGIATLLAALSKENGALLPLLALIILWLWIPKEKHITNHFDRWLIVFLIVLPSMLLLTYLANEMLAIVEHGYGSHRYFTPGERLLSQPTILLDYVRNLFFPQAFSVSPFMDMIPAPRGWLNPPVTLFSALIWVLMAGLAILSGRTLPAFIFGLTFFLVGHVLESSFIGLELYFSHRNYVPAFGLYFALVYALANVPKRFERLVIGGFLAYLAMFALVLYQTTSGWKHIQTSAMFWMEKNPYSERGAQVLSNQLISQGDFVGARKVLDSSAARSPDLAMLQIQRTQFCVGQEDEFLELLKEVTHRLRTASYHPIAAVELFKAAFGDPARRCPGRDHSAVSAMADALLENPVYAESAVAKSYLLAAKGLVSAKMDDVSQAISLFTQAFHLFGAQDFVTYGAYLMADSGQHDKAYALINEAREKAPTHPFKRAAWLMYLDKVQQQIEESQRKGG